MDTRTDIQMDVKTVYPPANKVCGGGGGGGGGGGVRYNKSSAEWGNVRP